MLYFIGKNYGENSTEILPAFTTATPKSSQTFTITVFPTSSHFQTSTPRSSSTRKEIEATSLKIFTKHLSSTSTSRISSTKYNTQSSTLSSFVTSEKSTLNSIISSSQLFTTVGEIEKTSVSSTTDGFQTTLLKTTMKGYYKCYPIENNNLCHTKVNYNQTSLPNFLKHTSPSMVNNYYDINTDLKQLIKNGRDLCKNVDFLICSSLWPSCYIPAKMPCREWCKSISDSCSNTLSHHGLHWPHDFDCDEMPSKLNHESCFNLKGKRKLSINQFFR